MTFDTDTLTERLDQLETDLPPIPAKAVALSRAATRRTTAIATTVVDELTERTRTVGSAMSTAAKTSVGQAKSAAGRTAATARSAVAETTGQASAQAERALDVLESETGQLLDDATDAVDPRITPNPASLEDLTKDELYVRAQERDIEGRASMNKAQLVAALRS